MNNKDILLKSLASKKYYTNKDLRMNRNYGFLLSNKELNEYLQYKEEEIELKDLKIEFPLLSWNSKKIFLYLSNELISLINDYTTYLKDDLENNHNTYVVRNFNEVTIGMLCSELDGTLKIEGVNTTRRQIEQIIKQKNSDNKNDKIIYNMYLGFKFISEAPDFNKENLKKLYDILSDGCLAEEDKINDYYRNDKVYIDNHSGCPIDKIDECMDSLINFVNKDIKKDRLYMNIIVPIIAHYYILYIHPYFDYNGRTARMVQLWLLIKNGYLDLYLSEAINDNKSDYYNAINDSRNSHNDLTYFVTYIFKLCNTYTVLHKNLESIKEDIESKGETITNRDLHYLKRIIINKDKGWFTYKKFNQFQEIDITKAGALKILNNFENYGLLKSKKNKSNEKIFLFNEDILKYELK